MEYALHLDILVDIVVAITVSLQGDGQDLRTEAEVPGV